MNVLNQVRVIIYRINKKGLEILLIDTDGQENWQIPGEKGQQTLNFAQLDEDRIIELDPIQHQDGSYEHAVAVEGDWHDIPSIRAMVRQDVRIVKDQIKQHIPELEQGTYFAVKEAVKKVMPHEYKVLKELKDILLDRNQAKYI
ncbi:MAG: hypothetical protein AAFO94_07510 [Bacteroidota bacterium]